ncbi:MAG: glycosyltransferase family 2 protein [Nitrospirae bacterium]|nr:glycosyltransferase family 2 protein [Nitrospirota bacterium]
MKESLSVVIPTFNEELRIPGTIEKMSAYLDGMDLDYEIIVVDDGSSDGTVRLLGELGKRFSGLRLLTLGENTGKGAAVRKGVLASRGSLVLMSDADMSTPIEEIERLLPYMRDGIDIALGSRGLRESDLEIRQPWYREWMGKTFNLLVRGLGIRGIKDTQCGFKLFKGDIARRLFAQSSINGFSFDVEILFIAAREDCSVKEVPIRWLNSPASKVNILWDPVVMLIELLRIKLDWHLGKYDKAAGAGPVKQ